MKIYNPLTRKVEEFTPMNPPYVGMYSCGPTVYSTPHIGNLRAYVFVDTLRRTLEANGFLVNHVMNITDVGHLFEEGDESRVGEDKLEHAAQTSGKTAWEIAEYYTNEFLEFLDELNIERPKTLCRATDHIEEMIQLIKILEEKGFTYRLPDGIYFDTSKLPDYGKLAGGKSNLKAGARVEMVAGKKNPTDFSLWKFSPADKKRQMEWESPWGRGFPGWHIECSAMSMKYLGETFDPFGKLRINGERSRTIDIHTGGIDHIPIHHTNEIAQSEAATGHEFVKYWMHNEFILVEGKKMSKSLGNVYTLHDIKKRSFNPIALRYLFLTASYRDQLNFTWEGLGSANTAYERLMNTVCELKNDTRTSLSEEKSQSIEKYGEDFFNHLNNDLGAPGAIAVLWEVVKSNIPNRDKYDLILSFDEVLGLNLEQNTSKEHSEVPEEIKKLVGVREKLRAEDKWEEADEVRKQIEEMGYIIEDSDKGPKIKRFSKLSF